MKFAFNLETAVLALVFVAVIAVFSVAWRMLALAGRASSERIEIERHVGADGRQKAPIERFISAGRLFRLRFFSAVLPVLVIPTAFLACGLVSPLLIAVLAAVGGFVGWMAPYSFYRRKVARRQRLFETRILDLTLGLANALRAGMALPQALERIGQQLDGPMREELEIVQREYRLGIDLVVALERMGERMPCEDLKILTSSIRLTTKSGGSLVEVLTELTSMIRGRTEFRDRLRSLTASGRLEAMSMALAPVAAFGLLFWIHPDLMRPLVTTTWGWCTLCVAAGFECIGYFFINKIVTIDV